MFNAKHLFVALALTAGFVHSGHVAFAHQGHQIVVNQKLVLSPAQAKQIDAQREKTLGQIIAIHKNARLGELDKETATKSAFKSFADFLGRTLTSAQMGTLGGPAGIHQILVAGHEMEFITAMLDLTPNQIARAQQVHDEIAPQASAIQNDSSLSESAKQEKLGELHMSALHRVAEFLSPEQQQRLHAMLQAHMGGAGMMGNRSHGNIPPQ